MHTFTFTLPAPAPSEVGLLRASVLTGTDSSSATPRSSFFYTDDPFLNARPSSAYLGPPSVLQPPPASPASPMFEKQASGGNRATVTYHGVCLTVWSHADTTRVACIVGGHGPGGSTLFLPGDTVFWLPYALSTYIFRASCERS